MKPSTQVVARMMVELQWEMRRGIELALFRTFGSPRIAALLARTGKSTRRPEARREATERLIHSLLTDGYDSPRGAASLQAMNRVHSAFDIPEEDYLYVMATLFFEPVRFTERY